jgi:CHAD domain-containing protein
LDAAARGPDARDSLHRVRIAGKRLRYAAEVFADCFHTSFRETVYPALEEMQDLLGSANDSRVAVSHLTRLAGQLRATSSGDWRRYRTGIGGLRRHHERRLLRERRRFEGWWAKWHASGGKAALVALIDVPSPPDGGR